DDLNSKLDTKFDSKRLNHITSAIDYLINRKEEKHIRAYTNGYNLMYFNYTNEGINITEFYNLLDKDKNDIIEKFDLWLVDKTKKIELLNLLTLTLRPNIPNNYKKYIDILLGLKDYEFADRVFRDIY